MGSETIIHACHYEDIAPTECVVCGGCALRQYGHAEIRSPSGLFCSRECADAAQREKEGRDDG